MAPYGRNEVLKALSRMLSGGRLTNLPKRREDLDVFLALAAARLRGSTCLGEAEVNNALKEWLSSFCSPYGVDHVTLRRYLVDTGLLERNREGSAYQVVDENVDGLIERSAQEIAPERVLADIAEQREMRRRQRQMDEVNRCGG